MYERIVTSRDEKPKKCLGDEGTCVRERVVTYTFGWELAKTAFPALKTSQTRRETLDIGACALHLHLLEQGIGHMAHTLAALHRTLITVPA